MREHTILIVRYNNICRVLPAHCYVATGDTIKFIAIKTSAMILAPNERLFADKEPRSMVPEGEEVRLIVGDPGSGVYPYAVFCDATNDFAVGDSSPDLIVY